MYIIGVFIKTRIIFEHEFFCVAVFVCERAADVCVCVGGVLMSYRKS